MKKLLILAAALIMAASASAQSYEWAIGVRAGGDASGLSVKKIMGNSNAIEAMVGWGYYKHNDGFNLTGLYEWNVPVIGDGFNFYYGGGAHLGSWSTKFNIGIDAVVGLEYAMSAAPIAFSVDYKPRLDFSPDVRFIPWGFALGVKYTF